MPVLADLAAESAGLDAMVAELEPAGWGRTTPAAGWTIAHQIAHLAWTDRRALMAVLDPDGFEREAEVAAAHFDTYVDLGARRGADVAPGELLARWRAGRARLAEVLAAQPHGVRFRWYGPPMSAGSMATGRLMETWAHGEDVADALGVRREPTARLRHVARIGVRARDFAFSVHGLPAPAEEFRVELTAPDGSLWTFGPEQATQRVTGPALDFCLLAVRRRHRDDVDLRAEGPDADAWLSVVQAFAGPPGSTRPPSRGAAR
ncbi:TIGR03084 family metal-binding protein [Actinacidiphila paucisporea]|uniref:TIGR03084 family protein n=1 Tax=Actinacidiphila paucisporea TaxID=310782 RepID=A0A1M7JPS6_9ACTN|nr:TIGR03084 family metal-binding protein [Actinacidiphila paucisporea]SHM54915.1 TIGR03084 family protein [Actinacidiphila paucisporea]